MHSDYLRFFEELVPHEPVEQWRHNDTGEDNADAHIKRQLMGREVVVAITDGKLDFGRCSSSAAYPAERITTRRRDNIWQPPMRCRPPVHGR